MSEGIASSDASATPGQAAIDPSSIGYRVHADAFNTLTTMLAADDRFVPLSVRDAVASAIVEAVEPLIRADERAIAAQEPHAAPGDAELLPEARYALVEQMGHRSTTGTVREVTFCGAPMLEVTDLKTGSVHLASPQSLYEVTWLTEPEARQRAKPWTAVAIPAADPWGTAESDLDDADADAADEDDADAAAADEDDGAADEGKDSEAEAKSAADWIEDRSCRYDRDAEFGPGADGEARDLAPEAGAHPWFGPAGAAAAAPVSSIEAAARRAVGWPEDQPQQQAAAAASGAGAQAAQRMML